MNGRFFDRRKPLIKSNLQEFSWKNAKSAVYYAHRQQGQLTLIMRAYRPVFPGERNPMSSILPFQPSTSTIKIGVYGPDRFNTDPKHGCGLWGAGLNASIIHAEAEPVRLETGPSTWNKFFKEVAGIVISGHDTQSKSNPAEMEELCQYVRKNKIPVLAIDHGMHLLNTSGGGNLINDFVRETPDALQHRHPPEKGQRHSLTIVPGSMVQILYGEGEVIVNSEHRRAVNRLAKGFRPTARALDGTIEAYESEIANWFVMGVQWQPACSMSSGLDIQLFRALIDAAKRAQGTPVATKRTAKAA